MANGSLEGVALKLIRAQKHLDCALSIISNLERGTCELITKQNSNGSAFLMVSLTPTPDPMLSVILGDFLFNLRSALDHLVWQLVMRNGTRKPGRESAFLITACPCTFLSSRKDKLAGISVEAITLMESLQPYPGRDNSLHILNKLQNIDKHRTLNLTTVVADYTEVIYRVGAKKIAVIEQGASFRHNTPFTPPQTLPYSFLFGTDGKLRTDVKMKGEASLFVAFQELGGKWPDALRVDSTMQKCMEFVRNDVIAAFKPFFD